MDPNNYLCIPNPDTKIYRVISLWRLLEMFDKERNVLVRPLLFKDAWENLFLQNEKFYCQCWTLQKASDAMWQIYSRDTDAIRIRSTVQRLAETLYQALPNSESHGVFVGKVHYLKDFEIKKIAKQMRSEPPKSTRVMAETLLVKRRAFEHESEIRLLFFRPDHPHRDLYPYHIDAHELITQIMIDPRMSWRKFIDFREWISRWTGFPKEKILRSKLYTKPRWAL
jgi:DUF2971 family protein